MGEEVIELFMTKKTQQHYTLSEAVAAVIHGCIPSYFPIVTR